MAAKRRREEQRLASWLRTQTAKLLSKIVGRLPLSDIEGEVLCMVRSGMPQRLVQFYFAVMSFIPSSMCKTLDQVEYFAGKMAVTVEAQLDGRVAVPFERDIEQWGDMDITTPRGFLMAVILALRIKDGGSSLLAVVCSGWVWINRASSRRSRWQPLGQDGVQAYVSNANLMVSRCVVLLWLFYARNVWVVLEQPASSLLQEHPRVQEMLHQGLRLYRLHLHMKDYGAPTKKPSWLYSFHEWVCEIGDYQAEPQELYRGPKKEMAVKHGSSVTGCKDLKDSQTYPRPFWSCPQQCLPPPPRRACGSLGTNAARMHAETSKGVRQLARNAVGA